MNTHTPTRVRPGRWFAWIGLAAAIPLMISAETGAGGSQPLRLLITGPDGLPLPGARVELRAAAGGQISETAASAEGRAAFRPPVKGSYWISARAEGFSPSSRPVDWDGGPQELTITLGVAGLRQEITVTSGSRVEELQQDSPVKVEAVTRETMMHTGYERLSDMLGEIPGVVTRSGSSGGVSAEQIRGVGARQVAVLQDGLPVIGARGIKSGNINLNRQSTGRLERVEVVKGAASALFGSDAIGGVVNMISREPTQKLQGNLNFSGGSLGIFDGRGDIGTRYKNLTLFLDLEQHRQNAYSLVAGSPATVGPDLRRNDLFFKTRYSFTPRFTLGFSANAYHNREEGRSFSETGLARGLYNDSVQNYALVGDLVPSSRTTVQLRAYSARYDENSAQYSIAAPSASPALANLNQRYQRLDGTFSVQTNARNLLQTGYEWVQDNYKGANRLVGDNDGRQITANDVWLQDKLRLSGRATLDIGGRITSHSLFGTQAVPKAGLVVRLSDGWAVRGSFGRGFRAPDLGQLFYRFANPASFYQVIGNPTLLAETSRSFSTGADYRTRRFRAGVSLFRNGVRNLIDTVNIGTPRSTEQLASLLGRYGIPAEFHPLLNRATYIYQNFGRIYTQGFELDAERAITSSVRISAAYTYLDARDADTKLALPQRHKHQGFVRSEYVNRRLGLFTNVRGSFFSNWYLNPAAGTRGLGYGIWDFYVAKNLARGLQAYFTMDNFAGSRDQKLVLATPTFDRPDYGRLYRIGLRWRFGGME